MNSLVRALTTDFDYLTSLFPATSIPTRSTLSTSYSTSWLPPVNVLEGEKGYTIELAAPGLSRDDFEISAEDGRLVVSVKDQERNTNSEKYLSQEFGFSRTFTRSWSLPSSVEASAISARYEAGILAVDIPTGKKKSKVAVRVE